MQERCVRYLLPGVCTACLQVQEDDGVCGQWRFTFCSGYIVLGVIPGFRDGIGQGFDLGFCIWGLEFESLIRDFGF